MTKILIIEDEPLFQKMIAHSLIPLGYEIATASDGEEGVKTAMENPPDLIICDMMMPKMDGFQVTRLLRRDDRFAHTPILILTALAGLKEKLEAFEAGADDFMTKPFEPAELVARVNVLLRRYESNRKQLPSPVKVESHIIAVHSLRGGSGCSSMAVNLGIGLANMWHVPTLIMDQVLTAGQVALMLNAPLKRTWADLASIPANEIEWDVLKSVVYTHESDVNFLAAPTYPSQAELISEELFTKVFGIFREHYEYIVVDLPHDFSGTTIQVLDAADVVAVLFSPELASVRAASAALDTYHKLKYSDDKIKLVLNWTFERRGLIRKNIEAVLGLPITHVIPFATDLFIDAINTGKPILSNRPNEALCTILERLAYLVSKPEHTSKSPFPVSQQVKK